MELWSTGIYLIGTYNRLATGCWLLTNDGEGAILELPPYLPHQQPPAQEVKRLTQEHDIEIKYLLCSHDHWDHIAVETTTQFLRLFPRCRGYLHSTFRRHLQPLLRIDYFESEACLELGGEKLYLVHAPKHSLSDTMVIFKGAIFTGDWELNTIRSVHDAGSKAVPLEVKLKSIATMERFQKQHDYRIHKVFAVHANDRRENVDFDHLMADTRQDRKFW